MTLNAFSQVSKNDSATLIPNSQLRTALKLIEKGKLAEQKLQIAKSDSLILEGRILEKDLVITKLESRVNSFSALVANGEARVKNAEERGKLDSLMVVKLTRDVKKQKRKTFFAWLIGGVATVASIIVFAG